MPVRRKRQGNAGARGIWGCRGGARRWGWDACMHWPRAPRMHVCCSRFWAREGSGGSGQWGVCTSAAAGGELPTTKGRSPHLGGRSGPARFMPNEQSPQEVRASGKNSSRQSPRPVQKAPPLRREGCASARKLSSANRPARAWCIYVHQLGTLHSPIPPENSLNPSRHPVTRGVMGAGSPEPGQGGATGCGPCARDGRCKHPRAVARRELTGGPRKCESKRRAHAGQGPHAE